MKRLAIGIGLTGKCNYDCGHCYSINERENSMPFELLKRFAAKGIVTSVNFGTGESFLYPQFLDAVDLLTDYKIKLGLTSNGSTVKSLRDEYLFKFNDIDFSLDFPFKKAHDSTRGTGAFDTVIDGIKRCRDKGISCSLATCLSNQNINYIKDMLSLANDLDVNLRVNIYKGIDSRYRLGFRQFWEAVETLINQSYLISCSEPVILPLLPYRSLRTPTADDVISIRIRPDGTVMPCVYWINPTLNLSEIIDLDPDLLTKKLEEYNNQSLKHLIPNECKACEYVSTCRGGCACRRLYTDINLMDEYCVLLNKKIPKLNYSYIESEDLVHANYLCTIIVKGGRNES